MGKENTKLKRGSFALLHKLKIINMKKYRITIRTYFGSFEIDDIEAKDEDDAFDRACEEAKKEIDYAKLDEVYEYDS